MQYTAELVGMYHGDVARAEREIEIRRSAEERGDDTGSAHLPSPARRHRKAHWAPRLALR